MTCTEIHVMSDQDLILVPYKLISYLVIISWFLGKDMRLFCQRKMTLIHMMQQAVRFSVCLRQLALPQGSYGVGQVDAHMQWTCSTFEEQ